MKTDNYFTIGSKHFSLALPCEDYATSGGDKSFSYGIISDGCSGIQARNDLASRAWSMSAERLIKNNSKLKLENFFDLLIKDFEDHIFTNTIKDELASLLCFYANQNTLNFWMMGDGGFVIKHLSGDFTAYEIKWEKNKPFYPIYASDKKLSENFKKELSDTPVSFLKTNFEVINGKVAIKSFLPQKLSIDKFEKGFYLSFDRIGDNIESFSIVSDGLWSFKEDPLKLISNVLNFNTQDEYFIKEKMKELQNIWISDFFKYFPKDDFAIVTLDW